MKVNFVYVSPSILPSDTANSIHVVMQCSALLKLKVNLKLYASRSVYDNSRLSESLKYTYGVNLKGANLITFFSKSKRLINLRIALIAFYDQLFNKTSSVILSRNLYFSFLHSVFLRSPLLSLSTKSTIQNWLITSLHSM